MKRIHVLIGMLCFVFFACEQDPASIIKQKAEGEINFLAETSLPTYTQNAYVGGLKLPNRSEVILSEDQSSVTFVFPEGIKYVSYNEAGEIELLERKTYTCTCSEAGSCTVFNSGTSYGCLHGSCG
ncbi:MAG: hypothetical protein AAF399_12335, partial [Bacteroidota bacterium]